MIPLLVMALTVQPDLGKETVSCKSKTAKKQVWIFKQWHLPPGTDTRTSVPITPPPQSENQTAIYRQLNDWIKQEKIKTILAEGCSGVIDANFDKKYNGWGYQDLKAESKANADYEKVVTHVPLKLEAKHEDKVNTICADDEKLVKEHSLAFSDARGATGFLTRIQQYKNDPKRVKGYLEGVIDAYKLPKNTTVNKAVDILKKDLKKTIERIKRGTKVRSDFMASVIQKTNASEMALVVGGAHVPDLIKALDKAGIGCTVIEPVGYSNDSEKLVSELEKNLGR